MNPDTRKLLIEEACDRGAILDGPLQRGEEWGEAFAVRGDLLQHCADSGEEGQSSCR